MQSTIDQNKVSNTQQLGRENDGPMPNSAHIVFDVSDDESSDTSTSDSPSKMKSKCEVCVKNEPKYTCPGCGVKTCCLACVKEHKVKLDCSGQRNKFAWIDKSQFSDMNLLNDYRFLENAERSVYSNKMVPRNRHMGDANRINPYSAHYNQRKRSRILISAAVKRGIHLRILPELQKHKSNTSFYIINSDTIEWHVEWQFVLTNCLVKDEKLPETTVLLDAVKKFGNFVNFPHLRKALDGYRKKFHLCRYLIKVEGLPANRKRFIELNPSQSMADNLKGLCLVEHPTVFVLPQEHNTDGFVLLDKDDLSHMHPVNLKHLTTKHPAFSDTECLQQQLLDPMSGVYKPDEMTNLQNKASDPEDKTNDSGNKVDDQPEHDVDLSIVKVENLPEEIE